MYETQIHQPIYVDIFLDTQWILDFNTNILIIAINIQVVMTLECIHLVFGMS